MAEYIEREAAAKAFEELLLSPYADGKSGCFSAGARDALKLARDMMRKKVPKTLAIPAANVRENVTGEWIYKSGERYKEYTVTCPFCGSSYMDCYDGYINADDFNFCPNCGADMTGGNDGK